MINISKVIDLTGQTFGRLTVIERASNDNQGRARWLCECSCEDKNKVIVSGYNLRNKKTQLILVDVLIEKAFYIN